MIELVEMEIREELSMCGYDGDEIPVICGSALCEIENKSTELGREKILELMEAVDAGRDRHFFHIMSFSRVTRHTRNNLIFNCWFIFPRLRGLWV